MSPVFVDTSFYVAILNARDSLHARAMELTQEREGRSLTTEYVLIELGNWLARSGDRPAFLRLLESLRSDSNTVIVHGEHSLFLLGLELYARRADKNWSLTDCISFVVMREHGLSDALTADRHFEQAGFKALLV